jgi:MarR family transcriptional regulator, organic hydroperoxide resistance regulator
MPKKLNERTRVAGPPSIGIGKLLRRAHMAFSREFRDRLAVEGATFGEFIHLERLWAEDGLSQTELSRRVGIETASSTAILDTLEKRGYIRRERNSADRRTINVFVTPAGAKLKLKLLACAKATNMRARRGMTQVDILAFFSLVQRIADNLEAPPKHPRNRKAAGPTRTKAQMVSLEDKR